MPRKIIFSTFVYRLAAILLVLTSLLSVSGEAFVRAQGLSPEIPTPQNTLNGTVTVDGGGFPAQARVQAWQGALSPSALVAAANGAYTLSLFDGIWQATVIQAPPTTTSPAWVYTGGPQTVHYTANPDPVAPVKTLDFTVTPATGTLAGSLIAPGGASLAGPNRVWVRAQNQEGQGNTVQVDETSGAFSVNVLPGNTILRFSFENALWAAPVDLSGAQWYVNDGAVVSLDPIQLIAKNARISGQVSEHGVPVSNLPVQAWRLDGAMTVKGFSDGDGNYSLAVIEGVWAVQVNPPALSDYVPAQDPQRVLLPTPTATVSQDLGVVTSDVTITGTLVDQNGALVPNLDGRVYALYPEAGRWPQFGQSARIKNSAFTFKLASGVSTQYRIKTALSDLSGYTAISTVNLSVAPGEGKIITIPVAPNNATISGHLIDRADGLPQTGLPAAIYAASNSGALKREKVNPLTAAYEFEVASTNTSGQGGSYWWLKAFVDPTTGWVVQQPRLSKVFLPYNNGNGASVTADFGVVQVNAVLSGTVTGVGGQPLSGALVTAVEKNSTSAAALRRWTYTNAQGRYMLRLPAGSYKVTADYRNLLSPLPAYVTLAPEEKKTVDLQFRAKNATVSGTVIYEGAPHTAFLRAYSSRGGRVNAQTDLNGAWTLQLSAGETWRIQAVGEEGTQFLKSARLVVTPQPGVDPVSHPLTLLPSETLPEGLILNFDAAQDQLLALSNGAQVIIPGGALAPSGMVSVAVHPKMDLADDAGATPVSFGYRLLAFDENRAPILHFNAPLTLVMPFTAEQLAKLGVTPEQLIPSYWDPASNSWKAVPNFSVQVLANGDGAINVTIDHFTDYGLLSDVYDQRIFIPVALR